MRARLVLWWALGCAFNVSALTAATSPRTSPLEEKATCNPGAQRLCLFSDRFRVTLTWRDFSGNTGPGQAVRLTADTGYFWFFNSANVEAVVKVIDGRGLNGHFWLFAGSLSNVQYTIFVTDTNTGKTKSYVNPSGTLASIADTRAFASKAGEAPSRSSLADSFDGGATLEHRQSASAVPIDKAACAPDATSLCLNGSRFRVNVSWRDFAGATGVGRAVPITADTGYFWFFGASNVELVVKVLDGRGVNGQFWIFFGSLSSVEFTITVTDSETGQVKVFSNPSGRLASVADTGGFGGIDNGPFASGLGMEPGTVFVGEPTTLTFSAALRSGVARPQLIQVRSSAGADVISLYDDGDLAKGDDIAGDGLYNNRLVMHPTSEVDQSYHAVIPGGPRAPDRRLVVVSRLSPADFARNVTLSSSLESTYQLAINSGTPPQQAANMIVAQLAARPAEVKLYGKNPSATGVWWVTKEGVLNAIVPSSVLAGQQRSSDRRFFDSPAEVETRQRPPQVLLYSAVAKALTTQRSQLVAKAGENEIGSNLGVVLAPFYWQFEGQWNGDESDDVAALLRANGFVVTERRNANNGDQSISIDDFKSLSDSGAIVVTSHGDNFYDGLATLWIGHFGESIPFWVSDNASQVIVLTGVRATEANRPTWRRT